ncbi:MAG: hypothetical protein ACKVP4_02815 [Hyphomicrobium sp.]
MKNLISTAGAALVIAATASTAMAASPLVASGKIERINPRAMHLTVNHRTYRYNPRLVGADLKRGENVRIFYRVGHGHRIANKIVLKSA